MNFQNFDSYKKAFEELIYESDNFEDIEKNYSVIGQMLCQFYNTKNKPEINKASIKSFDISLIENKNLHLFVIDKESLISYSDKPQEEKRKFNHKFFEFINHCINDNNLNINSNITKEIRNLAWNPRLASINEIHFHILELKPLNKILKIESKHKLFQISNCFVNIISLDELWNKNIPIPVTHPESHSNFHPDSDPYPHPDSDPYPNPHQKAQRKLYGEISSKEELKTYLISEADNSDNFTYYQLRDDCLKILQEAGFYEDIEALYIAEKKIGVYNIALDAYHYDEFNKCLDLFILDNDYENDFLNKNDIKRLLNLLNRLVYLARTDSQKLFKCFDISTEAGSFVRTLSSYLTDQNNTNEEEIKSLRTIRFVLISLRELVTKKDLDLQDHYIDNIKVQNVIFDLARLFDLYSSNSELIIDFTKKGFPLKSISVISDFEVGYDAYVGVISGEQLLNIYETFGQKLLSSNVRAYLSMRGKINKGIISTIKKEPKKFFAFNNGICLVASQIEKNLSQGITLIKKAWDLQIVNGGQTTASMLQAASLKIPLGDVRIPFKLTVLLTETEEDQIKRDTFVQNISRFSNSQNKITNIDLGSNHRFQICFDIESKKPNHKFYIEGSKPFAWFYERVRGARSAAIKLKPPLEKVSPKGLTFDPRDLAKWILSWEFRPHIASLGGQKSFDAFMAEIDKANLTDSEYKFVSSDFFECVMAKGILFRHLDALVFNSEWYKENKSYKVNTVEYTIALLHYLIKSYFGPDTTLNFKKIWREQWKWYNPNHPNEYCEVVIMDEVLTKLALHVRGIFTCDKYKQKDVGELVKKESTWKEVIDNLPRLQEYLEKTNFKDIFCIDSKHVSNFPEDCFK